MRIFIQIFLTTISVLMLFKCDAGDNSEEMSKLGKKVEQSLEEQRLLLKEVISLQKKVDKLMLVRDSVVPEFKKGANSVRLPNTDRFLGSDNAQYAILEFMDYECPYCIKYAKQVLPTIKKQYVETGKLKYAIRDFPLNFHSKAESAAISANCAGKQNKYWQMHEALVSTDSKDFGAVKYKALAGQLGLDGDLFTTCLEDSKMKVAVDSNQWSMGSESLIFTISI
jgi:protein-disulfide isomerase